MLSTVSSSLAPSGASLRINHDDGSIEMVDDDMMDDPSWGDIQGLGRNWRVAEIVGEDGELLGDSGGLAVVESDSIQFIQQRLKVSFQRHFTRDVIPSGQWEIGVPLFDAFNNPNFLPENIRRTEIIPQFLETWREVFLDEFVDALDRLQRFNDINTVDPEYLDDLLHKLGNFLDITNDDETLKRRLAAELGHFHAVSGTSGYIDFIGFVLNLVLRGTVLWTNDYQNFAERQVDSTYYKTNRVRVAYDFERFGSIATDVERFSKIFYRTAPIHDVMHELVGQAFSERSGNKVSLTVSSAHFSGSN